MNKIAPLGETIRDRRLALGYSLGQLATKVSKTASSIRAWERGESFPTEEESAALASALDLDAGLLVRLLPDSEVWQADPAVPLDVHNPWGGKEPPGPRSAKSTRRGATAAPDEALMGDAVDAAVADDATAAADEKGVDAAGESEPGQKDVVMADLEIAADEDDHTEPADDIDPAVGVGRDQGSAAEADVVDNSVEPAVTDTPVPVVSGTPHTPRGRESVAMQEAMTEAVPVVPQAAVAVFETPRSAGVAGAPSEPIRQSANPAVAAWDELVGIYHRVFDPSRRWIYRVRWVLLFISLLIMLRVLAWAASNLFDAIGQVLDSVSFTPSETPDVQN